MLKSSVLIFINYIDLIECRTPEREVRGSRPTAAVLCPWARHFTPRKYWLITQEAMAPSRYDWKIVDWDVKPQHNQPTNIDLSARVRFRPNVDIIYHQWYRFCSPYVLLTILILTCAIDLVTNSSSELSSLSISVSIVLFILFLLNFRWLRSTPIRPTHGCEVIVFWANIAFLTISWAIPTIWVNFKSTVRTPLILKFFVIASWIPVWPIISPSRRLHFSYFLIVWSYSHVPYLQRCLQFVPLLSETLAKSMPLRYIFESVSYFQLSGSNVPVSCRPCWYQNHTRALFPVVASRRRQ